MLRVSSSSVPNLAVHVFDHQQRRTIHVHQAPVQRLQAAAVPLRAVGQSPGVTLDPGGQAARQLQGRSQVIRDVAPFDDGSI